MLGFTGVPNAGDRFSVVETEARAREVTEYRQRLLREKETSGGATSLEQMMNQLKAGGTAKFPLIIKGDVQGSVEAINASLNKLSTDEVSAQILMSGVGGISESDVQLAKASGAIIIGFNVRANRQAADLAQREGIEIRYYNIIYDLVVDVKRAMSGLLSPERRETFLGNAEILEVFNISKVGKVAGCRVTEGIVERGAGVRLIRDHVVVHEGKLSTLKRFKDEVKEVPAGQECGMAFEKYEGHAPGRHHRVLPRRAGAAHALRGRLARLRASLSRQRALRRFALPRGATAAISGKRSCRRFHGNPWIVPPPSCRFPRSAPASRRVLRMAGLRPTRQRIALAELLFAGAHRHVSAEELHAEAGLAQANVSLATIYNTLHQFQEAGAAARGGD